jgi:ABC-type sulfate transport system substrate-binding protein
MLLLALHESPFWFVKESVKVVQQWDLLLHTDGHIVFQSVQSSENQVKYTYCMAVKREKLLTYRNKHPKILTLK